MVEQRRVTASASDALNQLAFAAFVDAHDYDRNIRRLRAVYRGRRERLLAPIGIHAPGCRVAGLAAGLQCLIRLPDDTDEQLVVERALARGVRVEGLSANAAPGINGADPAVVVGFGAPTDTRFETAISGFVMAVDAEGVAR